LRGWGADIRVSVVFGILTQLVCEKHFTVVGAYIAIVTGKMKST
jgi:hypothetical protein